MSGLNTVAVIDALTSTAAGLGVFDQVNGHEPKNAPPGVQVTCSVWCSDLRPASSGLASVSVRQEFTLRLMTSMLAEPQDAIEPQLLIACDALFSALCGAVQMGGLLRLIDIFGSEGEPLRMQAGYLNQDGKLFRVMDVLCPIVINDVWTETA
jgi:hypothetical protein